jgi:hypothetical protein
VPNVHVGCLISTDPEGFDDWATSIDCKVECLAFVIDWSKYREVWSILLGNRGRQFEIS